MRKGEIRVNRRRARPEQRLEAGDEVRLPPLAMAEKVKSVAPGGWQARLQAAIVHEDDRLLVLNKPSGLAVHGGSGLKHGMIETLRAMQGESRYLELVHRLDRETSGLILVARKPAVLRELHALLRRQGGIDKRYQALVAGHWPGYLTQIDAPLERQERASGERVVRVVKGGRSSATRFRVLKGSRQCSLVEASPLTGRTHQIRVHAAHASHPILGDEKYGTDATRALARNLRLRRLFLHASGLRFVLDGASYDFEAPLDGELTEVVARAFSPD